VVVVVVVVVPLATELEMAMETSWHGGSTGLEVCFFFLLARVRGGALLQGRIGE
jgi:hypothetical protein